MKKILVLNCGSSSLKFCVYLMEKAPAKQEKLLCYGKVEMLQTSYPAIVTYSAYDKSGTIWHTYYNKQEMHPNTTHQEAIQKIEELLTDQNAGGVVTDLNEINGIGHRVVQGGDRYAESVIIDDSVIKGIDELSVIAPLHNPAHVVGIQLCKKAMPNTPQVAVFDNAFHSTMPETSFLYALPYKYYEEDKVRKYGAHGTSHRYVAYKAAELMGKKLSEIKLITCHLGNGCSITAIKNGKVLDTSMGFTPLDGFMMGTRSGAVDPSAITHLMQKHCLSAEEFEEILNKKSGLLGVSENTPDYQKLQLAALQGEKKAKLALDMQTYQIIKYIGSYCAAMNGVDAVVFTGGIGENSSQLREDVLSNLTFLGIALDQEANAKRGLNLEITTSDSKVKAFVILTNEELAIAQETFNLL